VRIVSTKLAVSSSVVILAVCAPNPAPITPRIPRLAIGGDAPPPGRLPDPHSDRVLGLDGSDVFAFVKDSATDDWRGPFVAAPLQLQVSCDLITRVSEVRPGVVLDVRRQTQSLATSSLDRGLASATATTSLRLDSLIALAQRLRLCMPSTLANALNCLRSAKLISDSEAARLLQAASAASVSLDDDYDRVRSSLAAARMSATVSLGTLVMFLRGSGLDVAISGAELNRLVYQLTFATGSSIDSLRGVLYTGGLRQTVTVRNTLFELRSVAPDIPPCPTQPFTFALQVANVGTVTGGEVLVFVAAPQGMRVVEAQEISAASVAQQVASGGALLPTNLFLAAWGAGLVLDLFRPKQVSARITDSGTLSRLRWRVRRHIPPGDGILLQLRLDWR